MDRLNSTSDPNKAALTQEVGQLYELLHRKLDLHLSAICYAFRYSNVKRTGSFILRICICIQLARQQPGKISK